MDNLQIDQQFEILLTALVKEHKKATEEIQKQQLVTLKERFSKSENFAQFISYYPLNKEGLTFINLRQKFKESLLTHNLILESGDYNTRYISSLKPEEIATLMMNSANQVLDNKGTGQNILIKMAHACYQKCLGIHTQALSCTIIDTSWHEERLSHFFKKIALHLGRDCDIEYYFANDHAIAHVLPGKNTIFINRKEFVKKFAELCSEFKDLDLEQSKFIELVSSMVETIAHECMHLEDGMGCASTHDQRFKKGVAQKLQKFFIGKDEGIKSFAELSEFFKG